MSKLDCLTCEGGLIPVSSESSTNQKYDYKETVQQFYYKCEDCGKMFDEVIKSTTLRPLSLGNYKKAESLA